MSSELGAASLLISDAGAVRVVTMNRADRMNAIDAELHRLLTDVWLQLAADPGARAVVLTGAGRAFSAGGDGGWMQAIVEDPTVRWRAFEEARRLVSEVLRCPLPVVAAVNGPAVGLGASLASLCDVVLMSDQAYLADPHVSLGICAGDGAAVSWPVNIGLIRAKEYILTGSRIPADEAWRLGLANRVVPAEELMSEAMALAERLAGLAAPAVRATKRAMNMQLERMALGALDYACASESEDFTRPEVRTRLESLA